jgi:hypothetical protein
MPFLRVFNLCNKKQTKDRMSQTISISASNGTSETLLSSAKTKTAGLLQYIYNFTCLFEMNSTWLKQFTRLFASPFATVTTAEVASEKGVSDPNNGNYLKWCSLEIQSAK